MRAAGLELHRLAGDLVGAHGDDVVADCGGVDLGVCRLVPPPEGAVLGLLILGVLHVEQLS